MNLLGYTIYLVLAYIITVQVGWIFYRNGRHYILNLMHGDIKYTDAINKLLLLGYYLMNLGYCALALALWRKPVDTATLISELAWMIGRIILSLAIMHYINMITIYYLSKKHNLKYKES